MRDVVVGRNGLAAEQREAKIHERGAVGVGLVRDGADERGGAAAHLFDGFLDAVLADDGDVAFALEIAGGVDGAEGAGVVGGGDEDVLVAAMALEEFGDDLAAALANAAAVDADEGFDGEIAERGADGFEGAGDAALDEQAGFGKIEADDPVDVAVPLGERELRERLAGGHADAVVVDAEEGGVGMRDVDGDERDVGGGDLVADDGSDLVLDLELDDEIDAGFDELLRRS